MPPRRKGRESVRLTGTYSDSHKRKLLWACLICCQPGVALGVPSFVEDLEACIRNHALRLAETFPQWGDKCGAVTSKVDYQAMIYEETLTPIMNKHGYAAALWCATYSLGMVPIVDLTQPNNPNFDVWYTQLLCPWDFPKYCGASDDELTDKEAKGQLVCPQNEQGNPAKCAPNQHPQYAIWPPDPYQQVDPDRRTMSCALCGRLKRTFPAGAPVGAPDLIKQNIGVEYSLKGVPEDEKPHFTAWWDMHAFGAWLANTAAKNHHKGVWARKQIVDNINLYKASNGEEIHGYLWQSLRLLAYDTGTLQGNRISVPKHKTAVDHAHEVCEPMWWLSPQSMNDCAHASGHVRAPGVELGARTDNLHRRKCVIGRVCDLRFHRIPSLAPTPVSAYAPHAQGYFYYFFDIGKAVLACTDPTLRAHAPGPEYSWDGDARMGCAVPPPLCPLPSSRVSLLAWLLHAGYRQKRLNTTSKGARGIHMCLLAPCTPHITPMHNPHKADCCAGRLPWQRVRRRQSAHVALAVCYWGLPRRSKHFVGRDSETDRRR